MFELSHFGQNAQHYQFVNGLPIGMPDLAHRTNPDPPVNQPKLPIENGTAIIPQGIKRKRGRPSMRLSEEGKNTREMEQGRNRSKKQYEKKKQAEIERAPLQRMVTVDEGRQCMLKEIIVEPYHSIAIALKPSWSKLRQTMATEFLKLWNECKPVEEILS